MTSKKTENELSVVYNRSDETDRSQCGLYAKCSTCRYAILPKDSKEYFCFISFKKKAG